MMFNIFNKPEPKHPDSEISVSKDKKITENRLIFSFDDNGDVRAEVEVCDLTADDALKYADLIHSLSAGLYANSIIDILNAMSIENPMTEDFVKNTIISYGILSTFHVSNKINASSSTILSSDAPIVMPTAFYKKYQQT